MATEALVVLSLITLAALVAGVPAEATLAAVATITLATLVAGITAETTLATEAAGITAAEASAVATSVSALLGV